MTSLLSLDPSSHCCGLAHFPTIAGRNPQPDLVTVIRSSKQLPSRDRIDFIVEGVLRLARIKLPDYVVLEYSAGKVARRLSGRKVSGLAVMGQAQGEVRRALLFDARSRDSRFDPREIVTVGEEWTHGDKRSKEERALELITWCPIYKEYAGQDRGFDAADAVQLGLHWIAKHNLKVLAGSTP